MHGCATKPRYGIEVIDCASGNACGFLPPGISGTPLPTADNTLRFGTKAEADRFIDAHFPGVRSATYLMAARRGYSFRAVCLAADDQASPAIQRAAPA